MSGGMVKTLVLLIPAAVAFALSASHASDTTATGWFASWPERQAKLEDYKYMLPRELPDNVKLDVIDWLSREADFSREHFSATNEGLGEAYGEYYIDLTLVVVKLKDPRSIEALAKAMDVSGSVSTTLAEFGDRAVDTVVAKLGDSYLRESATYALAKFVQGRELGKNKLSLENKQRIRQRFIELAHSESTTVRKAAVDSLGAFHPDRELLTLMKTIAEGDPAVSEDKPEVHPVRRAARAVLGRWARSK